MKKLHNHKWVVTLSLFPARKLIISIVGVGYLFFPGGEITLLVYNDKVSFVIFHNSAKWYLKSFSKFGSMPRYRFNVT